MEGTLQEALKAIERIPGLKEKAEYALHFLESYAVNEVASIRSNAWEIQQTEEKFRSLFVMMSQGVVYQDAEGKIILANPAAEEMLGLSLDQMQGRSSLDPRWKAIYEDASEYPGEEHPAMLALKTGKKVENRVMGICNPNTGLYKWLLVNATPQFRENEKTPYLVFTSFTDFTELKKANESLHESERRLMNLYTNMNEGVGLHKMVFDEHGEAVNYRIIGINPQFEKILGLSENDVHNKLATEVYGSPEPPFLKEYLQVVKTGKPSSFEVYFPPMNKHFSISVSTWDRDGFATIFSDITERKQAEEKLLESETKFRSFSENSPYAIMIYQDDVWVYSNPAALEISGFTQEEIHNRKFWEFVVPESRDFVKQIGVKRQIGDVFKISYEVQILTKDGSAKWVFLTGNSITFSGKPAGIISVIDISDRKKMEFDLKAAVEKAQESDRLKSSFLANMSHEIRTPMNAILGFSELMGQPDTSRQEQVRYTVIINNAGKRLLHIINDIIDLSKLEAKQIEITRGSCNIYELVNAILESFRNMELLKQKTELSLVADLKEITPELELETDPVRLQQVLDNLVTNAIKYSRRGTITVGVREKQENSGRFVEFFVKDTGKGIPAEKIPIIFERFRQVEENEYHEGAGLGLSICKAFVEMLGGNIRVESEVDKGSLFTFCIPFSPVKSGKEIPLQGILNNSIDLKGMTILIAEDEDDSYIYLQQLLKDTNAKLLRAVNGDILLAMIADKPPDLILLDINMPGKTGYDCLREIHEKKYSLKIIVQTAYAMADERKHCLESGCDGYLAKPFNKKELFDIIADVLKPG